MSEPKVRVVVVDHNGGTMTIECLESLLRTEWEPDALDIVLVDNGSHQSIVEQVRSAMPTVRVMRSEVNRGFAGGNNLALHDLAGVDHVALVNNDVTVEPGWLRPLVDALDSDPGLGAACPKILLRDQYRSVDLVVPSRPRGRFERRALGIRLSGARVGGDDVWRQVRFPNGTWGPEWDDAGAFRWTAATASLLVPVSPGELSGACELRIDAPEPVVARFESDGSTHDVAVEPEPMWQRVPFAGPPFDVVNSVGTEITDDGYGTDRGYLEEDHGQFDESTEVFGWHGGAVLLRATMLDDIGLLDEQLFLYYEDLELSLRGRAAGWRYCAVPSSVVRHVHSATAADRWADVTYFTERNRLLVLTRHAPFATTARAVGRFAGVTVSYAWRDGVAPLARGRRPHLAYVGARLRALTGYTTRAPAAFRARRNTKS